MLLCESVLLAALGGVLGVFLAWGGLRLFIASAPPGFPRLRELSLDLLVPGFTAVIAILTGLLLEWFQRYRPRKRIWWML